MSNKEIKKEEAQVQKSEFHDLSVPKKYLHLFNKGKFDATKNILLIDTSYMIFHKFFALRNWYNRAFPDKKLPDDYDWLADEDFMTKYKRQFFVSLVEMCKKKNVNISNVVFAIDCKHIYIWRNKEQVAYKATRKESHTKSKFYSYKIFGIVIDEMLPKIIERYGCIILKHSECEADDVVANCVLLLNKGTKYDDEKSINYNLEPRTKEEKEKTEPDTLRKIYVVATDTDYIQICNKNVILMNLRCDELNSKYITMCSDSVTYLMSKILYGDVSDNIQCCMMKKCFLKEKSFNIKNISRNLQKCNENTDTDFIKCTKAIVGKVISNFGVYTYFSNLMEEARKKKEELYLGDKSEDDKRAIIKQSGLCKVIKDDQFVRNLIMIDFRMLPDRLKKTLDLKIKAGLGI